MSFIPDDTIQALRARSTRELPHYEAALRAACDAHPPPFGQAWYGNKYREVAADPSWLAASLIANAEKEAEGSRKLWSLVARTPQAHVAEAIRKHAVDEARHALLYVAMCDLVFPGAIDGEVRSYADALSPRYSMRDYPPAAAKVARESVLDELVQMNIGEIRTRIHQLLLRPVLTACCDSARHQRLSQVLDSLLDDETMHIEYTANLIQEAAEDGFADRVAELFAARVSDFNALTLVEVGESKFLGE
jgi:hypothetical protein